MVTMSADCEFARAGILRLQRMAGLTGRTAASRARVERQVWAVSDKCCIAHILT